MQKIKCEMCGSGELVKKDGYFVCQNCGTKYTIEEAQKLIVEGTVKIDESEDLQNLYKIARRAQEENNFELCAKYYEQIYKKNPDDWESYFYSGYYSITSEGFSVATLTRLYKKFVNTLDMIKNSLQGEEVTEPVISVSAQISAFTLIFFNMFLKSSKAKADKVSGCMKAVELFYNMGDDIDILFEGNEKLNKFSLSCWKTGIKSENDLALKVIMYDTAENVKARLEKYGDKIRKYDPSFVNPAMMNEMSKNGSCYIATCVYGSYDCPEVWTLRRYRDYTLDKNPFGRLFIKIYYALSPTAVKLFGRRKWFRNFWRKRLDKKVAKLKAKGVEDTRYNDKY